MELKTKFLFFYASFSPLFFILILKIIEYICNNPFNLFNYFSSLNLSNIELFNLVKLLSDNNIESFILFIFIIILSYLIWYSLKTVENYLNNDKNSMDEFIVCSVENKTDSLINYLLPYIIFVPGLNSIISFIGFVIVLILIFFVYIRTEKLLLNPFFIIKGYNFYKVKVANISTPYEKEVISLISKKDSREISKKIKLKNIYDNLYKF